MRFWLYKHAKRGYNLSHLTKVSAQTSGRGCKQGIQLGKTLYRFLDYVKKKIFYTDFEGEGDKDRFNQLYW